MLSLGATDSSFRGHPCVWGVQKRSLNITEVVEDPMVVRSW